MIQLTSEDKSKLKALNDNKNLVNALKKLFLNTFLGRPVSTEVPTLAAERLAIEFLRQAFYELSVIQPDEKRQKIEENLV